MNISKLLHITFYVIFLVSLNHTIQEPGSILSTLSIASYLVAILLSAWGYASSNLYAIGTISTDFSKTIWNIAAAPFLLFSLTFAYFDHQVMGGQKEIAKWIIPYPSITNIEKIQNVHHNFIWKYLLESNDQPEKIYSYYDDESHSIGWHKDKKGSEIIFRKPNYSLIISASKKSESGSTIFYILKAR